MTAPTNVGNDRYLALCLLGLAGALLTGLGEGLLQLVPHADYTDVSYGYFASVPDARQSLGHFLAILAAPLYLPGYWHLTRNLAPARPRLATALFGLTSYAFILGAVWIGQRYFLATTVKAIAAGDANNALLHDLAAHNEPLVNALRLAMVIFSVAWVWLIASGQSRYPRWMAIFSPALLLGAVFALYFSRPDLGWIVLPTAMNTAHVVVFTLSLLALSTGRKRSDQ